MLFLAKSLRESRAPLSKNEIEADFQSFEKLFRFFFRSGKQRPLYIMLYIY